MIRLRHIVMVLALGIGTQALLIPCLIVCIIMAVVAYRQWCNVPGALTPDEEVIFPASRMKYAPERLPTKAPGRVN